MSVSAQILILFLICLLVGAASCLIFMLLAYKFFNLNRSRSALIGVITFAGVFGSGGYLAIGAQPEPGAAFMMMLAAALTLLLGAVAGPLLFVALTREVDG